MQRRKMESRLSIGLHIKLSDDLSFEKRKKFRMRSIAFALAVFKSVSFFGSLLERNLEEPLGSGA